MIPAAFEYHAPATLRQAVSLLREYAGEARVLAGGQSLVPMMKLRLANPTGIVDLRHVDGLTGIEATADGLAIGAMTTHDAIASSALVRERAPLLVETVATVGDVQIRNRGTIGGSVAHADPAADLPAALLACEARINIAGGSKRRTITATRMFVEAFTTVLGDSEIITSIEVQGVPAGTGWAYEKLPNKASRFAIVGVAALITLAGDGTCGRVRIGVTGAGPMAFRARAAERYLTDREPSGIHLQAAAERAPRGVEIIDDIHGSPDYRRQVTMALTRRALVRACERAEQA